MSFRLKDLLFPFIQICKNSYISLKTFVEYDFQNPSLQIFYCSKSASTIPI
jgi:hypothetical protein